MSAKTIYRLGGIYAAVLLAFTVYVLLDAFVIARAYTPVHDTLPAQAVAQNADESDGQAVAAQDKDDTESETESGSESGSRRYRRRGSSGGWSWGDSSSSKRTEEEIDAATTSDEKTTEVNNSVTLTTMRYLDSDVYVVDIYCDGTSLMTALAGDVYGKNVTDTTSNMAEDKGATVAINGDYYGARSEGYVVRNGTLYRDKAGDSDQEDLVIYADGSFEIVRESDVTAQELVDAGAWQVFSFGPGLVDDGEISVTLSERSNRGSSGNPRTAIGLVGEGHYVFVVTDGRSDESGGLTLYELATFMAKELGVETAYNLDGGGSTTLYLNGEVINNPSGGGYGSSSGERKVSDIVYVKF